MRRHQTMRCVLLEVPQGADAAAPAEKYARAAVADAIEKGEAPLVPRFLPGAPFDPEDMQTHELVIGMGLAWGRGAEATVVYTDLGITAPMAAGIRVAQAEGRPVEYRQIPGWAKRGLGIYEGNNNDPAAWVV
jgi:hypothetical protein